MNTHIWRYLDNQRNYPGYHLSGDVEGCNALLSWLRRPEPRPAFRLQPVTTQVLGVPNNQGGLAAYVGCGFFQLHVKLDASQGHFAFSEASGRLSLECSQEQVARITKGVEDVLRGEGDYCIGGGGQQALWFWWYPAPLGANKSVQRTGASRSAQKPKRMSGAAGSRR
jgi:hypothetical protein